MPDISPVNTSSGESVTTPTKAGFPFPSHGSPSSTALPSTSTTSFSASTKAPSISTSATSSFTHAPYADNGWPTGPPIRPFDYSTLVAGGGTGPHAREHVHAELDRIVNELGEWLASIDAGMTQILAESG